MIEVSVDELRQAVEHSHACRAVFREAVVVKEEFEGQTAWEGIVHVFDIDGHPSAKVCYAWSATASDTDRRRFYAVLHQPPVDSPNAAVKAAIVADTKSKGGA